MVPITPDEIRRILEVTDNLGIHRESVVIPLAKEGDGRLHVSGSKLDIAAPEGVEFQDWLDGLPERIRELDWQSLKLADPD